MQTARANFRISPLGIHPEFITARAEIKKAAAQANLETGKPEPKTGEAIVKAAGPRSFAAVSPKEASGEPRGSTKSAACCARRESPCARSRKKNR